MSWDLRLVRSFVALAEHGHVGRAAAAQHVSQPALSKQIRQLEASWGVRLFVRHARGVSVTEAGANLLVTARALLSAAADVDTVAAAAARSSTGVLRIGFIAQALNEHTSPLMQRFRTAHPDARLELRQYDMRDMSAGLLSGDTDLGILRGPSSVAGLVHHEFLSEPRVAVLRSDDPLARRRTLRLADMLHRPWVISANPDPIYQDFALAMAARGGHEPRRGPVVATVDEYIQAVLDDAGIGLAPLSATRYYTRAGIAYRRVIDAEPSVVYLSHRSGIGEPTPLAAAFVEQARQHATEGAKGDDGIHAATASPRAARQRTNAAAAPPKSRSDDHRFDSTQDPVNANRLV